MSRQAVEVAIDVAPVRAQPAGVGLYVARMAHEAATIAGATAAAPSLGLIGVRTGARSLETLATSIPATAFSMRTYHAWMQLRAEANARSLGSRLVHFTNAAAPLMCRIPYVLTVHDLSLVRMPRTHPVARWAIVPINLVGIARARTVIVPSKWTARELARIGVDERRLVVIPHAPTLDPALVGSDAVERFGLSPSEYVLYFGTLEPRKNIARLVGAFERVSATRPDLRLMLAGAPGWHYAGIARRIADSPARDRIITTGYVEDADLAALIRGSAAVAYASLYEGFGMPVLDAMALGASVVTSSTTAMPEAAGAAAILVDPRDEASIARGIEAAIARRAELIRLGLTRAAPRTWADVAGEHLDVYAHALKATWPT